MRTESQLQPVGRTSAGGDVVPLRRQTLRGVPLAVVPGRPAPLQDHTPAEPPAEPPGVSDAPTPRTGDRQPHGDHVYGTPRCSDAPSCGNSRNAPSATRSAPCRYGGSIVAERQGFEPWVPARTHLISSQAHSAALAPLLKDLRLCLCRLARACSFLSAARPRRD